MSGSVLPRTTASRSVPTLLLLVLCLIGAAVAAIVSAGSAIHALSLPARVLPSKGWSVTITEPMAALDRAQLPSPPVFSQPEDSSPAVAAAILSLVVFALVAFLVWRLVRRRPFARSLAITTIVAGCAIAIVAGVLAILASPANGFPASFVFAGILLVLVGLIADRGARLQRDTEGLV